MTTQTGLPQRWDGKDVVCDHEPRRQNPRDCRACGATQCETGVPDISLSLDGSTLVILVTTGITVSAVLRRNVYQGDVPMFLPRKVALRLGFALIIASRFSYGADWRTFAPQFEAQR